MIYSHLQTRAAWPDVIVIHGLMESGKSTLASVFMEKHGYVREKFADPLKNMVRVVLARAGVSKEMIEKYVEGDLKKLPIPELNDPNRPEHHIENLGVDGIRAMLISLLSDCGMQAVEINEHLDGPKWSTPIVQMEGVTTAERLFDTLLNRWSKEMLQGETIISRRMMQTLGDEWRNMHSNRLWASITRAKTEKQLSLGNRVIIDDNRYAFESQEFINLRPMRFVVTRGDKHFQPITEDIHPGERPMPVEWFDFWIANNGTRDALWKSAEEALDIRAAQDLSLTSLRERYQAAARQLDVA
jgi:hypothetical protein